MKEIKESMPKISVITGALNAASCFAFENSINSVLRQTFSDFEFLICDDGSTDSTWDMLTEYSKKDGRIKLLRNDKNLGLAASLNRCLKIARGRYIARHDCDDYNDLHRFEKQLAFLEKHKDISVLGSCVYLFDENGVWGKRDFHEFVENKDFLFTSPYKHGSVMFRREALLKVGGYRVSKETYRTEDYDLFMRLQMFCRGANLLEYLYYYCEDKNSQKRRKYNHRIDELKVRYRGFKQLGLLPKGLPYVVKPLVVGLIPSNMLNKIKDKYYDRK